MTASESPTPSSEDSSAETPTGLFRALDDPEERAELFQALVDGSSDVLAILDGNGEFRYVSPASRSVLGYEPEELVGEHAFDYVHPDDREHTVEQFYETMAEPEETSAVEHRFRHREGGWLTLESRGSRRIDVAGVDSLVVNARDVTERVERERELERRNERLKEFATRIAHDVRNPLNVISGSVDLVRATGDLDHLDHVEDAAGRMERLVDDLLTLAQRDETDPTDLRTAADRAWRNVDTRDAGLTLADGLGAVPADTDRLVGLFENLFRNAVEHAGPGVRVRVGPLLDDDGFYVEDDGPGIPPEERERVFEHGYSTTDGVGVGLTIARTIARTRGWSIEIADPEEFGVDGGARFVITGIGAE